MYRRSLLVAIATLAGCGAPPSSDSERTVGTTAHPGGTRSLDGDALFGLPSVRRDGNPTLSARLDLRTADSLDVGLPAKPVWLAGVPDSAGSRWAAVLDDGRVVGIALAENGARRFTLRPERHDGPPLLVAGEDSRVAAPAALAAHTHPVPVAGGLSWVRQDGRLETPGGVAAVDALPDAVPVAGDGRVFVLAEPTESYDHGVLGDELEARSVAVVDADSGAIERRLQPPDGTVIEGRSAMLTTLGDDQAIVVTASDATAGARLAALGVDGDWQAIGPPVGGGYRWRHQLAVAPFAPNGERAIAAVKTPHIGGVAEFYRRDGDRLRLAATDAGGYQSHEIGSRNLGGGIAGRLTGEDRWCLLLPDRMRETLVALVWTGGSGGPVDQPFTLQLDGALTTNVGAVDRPGNDEKSVVAAGTDAGVRFWRG
ncbi:MAG: hypothetical protein V5A38_07655 [Halolamina sp.]|uniref:hypothetical protein n=1 Tax=Halolamina sp. TaxID=1940283 RepID=UPI002FC30016